MRDNSGFTLIEIVITVAVSFMIIGTVTAMLFTAYRVNTNINESSKVLDTSRAIFEAVRKISANADTVEITDTLPADLTGKTYIGCIGNEIVLDGGSIYRASDMNASSIDLKFVVEDADKGLIQNNLSILDSNGDNKVQPQTQSIYLDEATSIVGTEGKYIVVTKEP